MKLIFCLHGRLGNHFFILSALLYAIKKYNIQCYLYIHDYVYEMHCRWSDLGLKYVFDNFNENIIYELPNSTVDKYQYYVNGELDLDKLIKENINTNNIIVLDEEYFQDKKFFLEYKSDIQKIFSIENNYKDIIDNNDVFISVRRGDFITAKFYVLNEDYYIDAYNKYFSNKNIYISCDDIEWCKENLTINRFNNCKNITYIENYKPLEIVSIAKWFSNYICANSTFSWMCSLMSINDNANVITVPTVCNCLSRNGIIKDNDIFYDLFLTENKKYIDTINNSENAVHDVH